MPANSTIAAFVKEISVESIFFPIYKCPLVLLWFIDPNAEVVALSPTTLMATNRFVCEICNKGFQRDQNLQLHRRGHNLPWKLRQRSTTEAKKRVYICPEPTCVHHNPARALGDLTGIKKHYSRKHGEKKWKCDKCSKKYAVQSDWKAHQKTCGTREYKCDCGTIFSRFRTKLLLWINIACACIVWWIIKNCLKDTCIQVLAIVMLEMFSLSLYLESQDIYASEKN